MTADLDAIRARLAAVTPGPWRRLAGRFVAAENGDGWSSIGAISTHTDTDLIAHAPADLAALCDEVESLRAAVERVRAVALGEDDEAWVRRVGMSCLVSSTSVLEALDGAE